MTLRRFGQAAAAAAGAALILSAAPALASLASTPVTTPPPVQLSAVKAADVQAVDAQLHWLAVNRWFVSVDPHVLAADRAALIPGLRADESALQAARAKIVKESTVAGLEADMAGVNQLRVFAFTLPRVGLVGRADDTNAIAMWVVGYERRYATGIAAAKKAGKNVTAAQAAYSDYVAKVAAARTASQAVRTSALGLTLAGYPANAATLAADTAELTSAQRDLIAAGHDAAVIATVMPGR